MTAKESANFKAMCLAVVQYERMLVASFEERVLLRQRETDLLQKIADLDISAAAMEAKRHANT